MATVHSSYAKLSAPPGLVLSGPLSKVQGFRVKKAVLCMWTCYVSVCTLVCMGVHVFDALKPGMPRRLRPGSPQPGSTTRGNEVSVSCSGSLWVGRVSDVALKALHLLAKLRNVTSLC